MDRHARVVQAALQLRDELPALLGDEWPQLDARLAAALQAAIEHPGADRLTALLAAARAHPLAATRFDDLLGGNWRSRPIAPDGQPNRGSFEAVEVLYATNRARGSPLQLSTFYAGQPADGDQVELGRCVVTLPTDRERGELNVPGLLDRLRGLDPARHVLLVSIDPLREHDFAAALGAAAPQRRALVFIHGYNVAFDDAMRRTAQLKVDLAYGRGMLLAAGTSKLLPSWGSR